MTANKQDHPSKRSFLQMHNPETEVALADMKLAGNMDEPIKRGNEVQNMEIFGKTIGR